MTAFFDSNILVYAYSDDRRRVGSQILVAEGGLISAQVLNEMTNVLRRKQRQEWPVIEAVMRSVRVCFPVILPLTANTHACAVELARDDGFSFYDALIVASAVESGCDTLYSEDLQNGRTIGSLTIRNPFA